MGQAETPDAVRRVWEPDPPYPWAQLRKQTQFSPAGKQAGSFRGEQCKTNPICRSCQQSVVGRLCKTNPIPGGPRYPSIPLCHHSNIPAPSVLCETKPIPPDRQDGQVLGGKGVMANLTCKRPPQNKANSHIGRTGPRPEMPPPAGTSVRNKANWPRTDWKRRWAGAGNAADDAASVRNKANSRPGPTRGIWNMSLRAERGNLSPDAGRTRGGSWHRFPLARRGC